MKYLLVSLAIIVSQFAFAADGHIRSDNLGGYYTDQGHYQSDGLGGYYTPDGGHLKSDGLGGWFK